MFDSDRLLRECVLINDLIIDSRVVPIYVDQAIGTMKKWNWHCGATISSKSRIRVDEYGYKCCTITNWEWKGGWCFINKNRCDQGVDGTISDRLTSHHTLLNIEPDRLPMMKDVCTASVLVCRLISTIFQNVALIKWIDEPPMSDKFENYTYAQIFKFLFWFSCIDTEILIDLKFSTLNVTFNSLRKYNLVIIAQT